MRTALVKPRENLFVRRFISVSFAIYCSNQEGFEIWYASADPGSRSGNDRSLLFSLPLGKLAHGFENVGDTSRPHIPVVDNDDMFKLRRVSFDHLHLTFSLDLVPSSRKKCEVAHQSCLDNPES